MIRLFEEYGPEHSQRHKTGRIPPPEAFFDVQDRQTRGPLGSPSRASIRTGFSSGRDSPRGDEFAEG